MPEDSRKENKTLQLELTKLTGTGAIFKSGEDLVSNAWINIFLKSL